MARLGPSCRAGGDSVGISPSSGESAWSGWGGSETAELPLGRKGMTVKSILGYGVAGTVLLATLNMALAAELDVASAQATLVHETDDAHHREPCPPWKGWPQLSRLRVLEEGAVWLVSHCTNPSLTAPANLKTTTISASQVQLNWTASTGGTGIEYEVWRTVNGVLSFLATATTNSYTDSVSAGAVHVYKVRAKDVAGRISGFSNSDHSLVVVFADDPLVRGSTDVKATHFNELRTAANQLRVAAGLGNQSWGEAIAAGGFVRASHITELRSALAPALSALGSSAPTYTDPNLAVGDVIKLEHIEELRNAIK